MRRTWLLLACLATAGCAGLNPEEHPVSQMVPPLKLGVYTADAVDVRPVIVHEVPADFPSALGGYLTAKATVVCTVGIDGKPTDEMVVEADDAMFGDAAKEALSKWRFRPALLKSQPVPCRITLPFYFDSPYAYDHSDNAAPIPSGNAPTGGLPAGSVSGK